MTPTRRRLTRVLAVVAAAGVGALFPAAAMGRHADAWRTDDPGHQVALARGVVAHFERSVDASTFSTGAELFDSEWAFGAQAMALAGLAQTCLLHPEATDELRPAMRSAARRLVSPALRRFGVERWRSDPLLDPDARGGHAYLGYANLALGLHRLVDPAGAEVEAHERLSRYFDRRLAAAPHGLVETYPGEAYPVDVTSVAASLAVHARVTGVRHDAALDPVLTALRRRYRDPGSGLLVQSASADDGTWQAEPRASGTALAAYYLSYVDERLARELWEALDGQAGTLLGFGGLREYGPGYEGRGDVDSGPVLFGIGVSATGFGLAAARRFGSPSRFRELMATTVLFGMPWHEGDRLRFASGGPLGDAILLAMLTAVPLDGRAAPASSFPSASTPSASPPSSSPSPSRERP